MSERVWVQPLPVERDRWFTALRRALDRALKVRETDVPYGLGFLVESFSGRVMPNTPAHLVLIQPAEDGPRVSCECERGTLGGRDRSHVCQHSALALWHADLWPFPAPGWPCPHCKVDYPTVELLLDHIGKAHVARPRRGRPVAELVAASNPLTRKGGRLATR